MGCAQSSHEADVDPVATMTVLVDRVVPLPVIQVANNNNDDDDEPVRAPVRRRRSTLTNYTIQAYSIDINGVVMYHVDTPSGAIINKRYNDFKAFHNEIQLIVNVPQMPQAGFLTAWWKRRDAAMIEFRRERFQQILNAAPRDRVQLFLQGDDACHVALHDETKPRIMAREQSPIDLTHVHMDHNRSGAIELVVGRADLHVHHDGTMFVIHWTGDSDSHLILRDGRLFRPIQIHIHAPSEHTVMGRHHPLCMHIVHKSADGHLAVVCVFFDDAHEENAFADQWWPALATVQPHEPPVVLPNISFAALGLGGSHESYYCYDGSLTTPPYTEGVAWVIVETPRPISRAQIQAFARGIPDLVNTQPWQVTSTNATSKL
ncbi:Aste57867_11303 [Aphanomyces stellatus]|uniref:carbonic anhydrase n=1 Tax=Aphanomyces stellatus TaxID=120398 RepID=A0A485KSZ3_9STRA|nr:hypothetical protein As57867_011261 [Aphanomyces stellatus]VFT88165.1 Aste57867_11303 [Aphanomyces stellatus]